jgi:hypothetical protein
VIPAKGISPYIEAISAIDRAIAIEPVPPNIAPYTIDAAPPFSNDDWKVTATPSHDACKVRPKATIGFRFKYLCQKLAAEFNIKQQQQLDLGFTSRAPMLSLSHESEICSDLVPFCGCPWETVSGLSNVALARTVSISTPLSFAMVTIQFVPPGKLSESMRECEFD